MAIESQGTVVAIGQGDANSVAYGSEVFDNIGEVKTFGGPNGSASVIDVSHLGSTRREKLMGLPDDGQISFGFLRMFGDAGQESAKTARSDRELRHLKITYSDATVEHGTVFVLEMSTQGGVDQALEGSMTVEIDGEWVEV